MGSGRWAQTALSTRPGGFPLILRSFLAALGHRGQSPSGAPASAARRVQSAEGIRT